jgi:hypothetical protein
VSTFAQSVGFAAALIFFVAAVGFSGVSSGLEGEADDGLLNQPSAKDGAGSRTRDADTSTVERDVARDRAKNMPRG